MLKDHNIDVDHTRTPLIATSLADSVTLMTDIR